MSWELCVEYVECGSDYEAHPGNDKDVAKVLENGWEPFATERIGSRQYYHFRRPVKNKSRDPQGPA